MPHKRNPITAERLSGLARVVRGNAVAALENVALWHERDISHSSAERIILPDSCMLLDYMLYKLRDLIEKLQVYPENMERNLGLTKGLYFSQSILLALTRAGANRQTAYEAVQRAAMRTWKGEQSFAENAKQEPEITALLSPERNRCALFSRRPFPPRRRNISRPRVGIARSMFRAARARHDREVIDGFRQRGLEVSRLESFSDAVFGFALTLLVVSLDVPKTVGDLFETMRGFPAFALCFLFLALIWNSHYKFCRRYGLDDGWTRFLTCVLLFVVLFYIYPLKFLFNISITGLVFGDAAHHVRIGRAQFSNLLTIYDLGFAAVYAALILLYLRAYRVRDELELTELERFDTRHAIYRLLVLVGVALAATILARIPRTMQWSGAIFASLFPFLRTHRILYRRWRAPLLAETAAR